MAQDELQLKIVLDDGQVVKGFLNIEKAAAKTAQQSTESFSKSNEKLSEQFEKVIPGQLKDLSNKIFDAFNTPLGRSIAVITAVGVTIKKAFDFTLEGEKLLKIEKQFDSLANTFGVAGDTLKNNFVGSLGGLVDDSDAIQALNKAFVTLGDKVTQLPQVMEIARKATNLFGGDVTQNFEAINQAIATGATRQLRGLGIIIDSDKAYEKYAKSIGTTKDALTESGRQQAILNEVLEKGAAKFKNVSAESGGATDAFQRLKVSSQNLFEDITKVIAEKLSPLFATLLDGANSFVQSISSAFGLAREDVNSLTQKQKDLTKELEASTKMAEMFQKAGVSSKGPLEQELKKAQGLRLELAGISEKIENIQRSSITPSISKDIGSVDAQKEIDLDKKRQTELTTFLAQEEQKRINSKIQQNALAASLAADAQSKLSLLEENFSLQEQLREEQKQQQIASIKQKYREQNLTGSIFEKQSIQAVEESDFQQRLLLEQQRIQQLKQLQDQANFDTLSSAEQVSAGLSSIYDGAKSAAKDFSNNAINNFREVGKQAFQTLGRGVGQAFAKFGEALAKGEDAGQAFLDSMLGIFGDLAIQIGTQFILQGIAFSANPVTPGAGSAMVAAGIALATFGGILKGISGGKGKASTSGAGADTGGGIASTPSPTTDITNPQDLRPQAPATQVAVNISGSVYDSDETGSRIVDLINQAFDKKGVVIQQGVLA